MTNEKYQEVIKANISLHSRLANDYNSGEPHFRPENVEKVEGILKQIIQRANASKMLDLGCGTGFLINIAKKYLDEIHGVDVTPAMLEKIDTSGKAKIIIHNHDTGSFPVKEGEFDMVTAYSFLHHLYEIKPTLKTAYKGLKSGGEFYADLEPNYYFWEQINSLNRSGNYDPIVKREIEMVTYKDEDIQKNFGVDKEVFNAAEYGKNIQGGFKEEGLKELLLDVGFKKVDIFYHWYIGQGFLINNPEYGEKERFQYAKVMDDILHKIFPLSKGLFKYIGLIATK